VEAPIIYVCECFEVDAALLGLCIENFGGDIDGDHYPHRIIILFRLAELDELFIDVMVKSSSTLFPV